MPCLRPDARFTGVCAIDIEADLLGCGVTGLLLDIDNTIRSRATRDVPSDVRAWLECARRAGLDMCFVSNNWHADVYGFAASLGIPVVAKACKPLPFAFCVALRRMGMQRSRTVVIGDQLSTDIWGAHLAGMAAYLVDPLSDVDLGHTAVIRRLERALLADVGRLH